MITISDHEWLGRTDKHHLYKYKPINVSETSKFIKQIDQHCTNHANAGSQALSTAEYH